MIDEHALSRLDELPPMPQIAREVLQVLNDREAGLAEVAASMSREPGLTGRLVAAANAAFFSGQRPIYNVDDAAVRLGLNRVRVIAISILLGTKFNPSRCPLFDPKRYWFEAMKTAICASKLVNYVAIEVARDAAYLCGLLHNIGLLLCAYSFPDEMEEVFETAREDADRRLTEIQRERLGFDYHEAGSALLTRWGMPPEVVSVVGHYHEERYEGDCQRLAGLIRICQAWAASNFREVPDSEQLRGVREESVDRVGQSCLAERDQLESFAFMLCSAA